MSRPSQDSTFVGCPECSTEVFVIIRCEREFELQCVAGHVIRRFFVLVPPPPPPRPTRSPHAAAQAARSDR